MIKFVSDLRQVGGFLLVLWFPPPIKLCEILLEVRNPNPYSAHYISYIDVHFACKLFL